MERRVYQMTEDVSAFPGAVLCRDVSVQTNGRPVTVRRGVPLQEALRRLPSDVDQTLRLHIVVPAANEIDQPEASLRLAQGIVGDGVLVPEPHQGQVTLRAGVRGVLRVRADAVKRLNLSSVALVATTLDGRVLEEGETIGIVKAPSLFVAREAVDAVLDEAGSEPVLSVAPLRVRRVGLLAGERIRQANLEVSSEHLAKGLRRLDAELTAVRRVTDESQAVMDAYRDLLDEGVELVLVAGTIVLDPEDPYLVAVEQMAGGRIVQRGAPIEPGTMFWVAYINDVPLFGLASCEMYGRISVLELLLPYALAGEPISDHLIAELGYGGLLDDTQKVRRPPNWYE